MATVPDYNDDEVRFVIDSDVSTQRLDSYLVVQFPQFSRAKIQRAITKGMVSVDGIRQKSSYKISGGEQICFQLPSPDPVGPVPENIPLDVVYEDEHIIGINKPPFMVVHPAKGHWSGTLTAALAFHFKQLSAVSGENRPGIVHRLDRDTSGIIVVAKTDDAHAKMAMQFEKRKVEKTYCALVSPPPNLDRDHIDQPIGIHPYQREKMAIRRDHKTSRQASSFYEVKERVGRYAKIIVKPKTGRTHQIRVHLAHIGSSVLADKLYSGRSQLKISDVTNSSDDDQLLLNRQALHALEIQFQHPVTKDDLKLVAPMPDDMTNAWKKIRDLAK
ncbi:MAG: RluA family pseudouridine synthase [Planctomycetota bacterium]